jgi:hypothetical protein
MVKQVHVRHILRNGRHSLMRRRAVQLPGVAGDALQGAGTCAAGVMLLLHATLHVQDGELVTFSEVVGMTQLNNHKPIRVKNCKVGCL